MNCRSSMAILVFVIALSLGGCAPYWEHEDVRKEVAALRDRVQKLEQAATKVAEDQQERRDKLQTCIQVEADQAYWDYVKLNGRPVAAKPYTYQAPSYVWEEARKRKLDKVEECKLLYGR